MKETFDQINNLTHLLREIGMYKQETLEAEYDQVKEQGTDEENTFWRAYSEGSEVKHLLKTESAKTQFIKMQNKLIEGQYKNIINNFDNEIKSIEAHLWNLKMYQSTISKKYSYYETLDLATRNLINKKREGYI
jgi:hypothetical protein